MASTTWFEAMPADEQIPILLQILSCFLSDGHSRFLSRFSREGLGGAIG